MDQKSDLIREDIDETRTQLTEKLEVLEDQLRGTVEAAKSTVEDTIENVRESLRKFTPTYQIQEHPLVWLGGAVATGIVVGHNINQRRQPLSTQTKAWQDFTGEIPSVYGASAAPSPVSWETTEIPATSEYEDISPPQTSYQAVPGSGSRLQAAKPSLWDRFTDTFGEEIEMVKGMAMGALLGTLRDVAKRSVPNLGPQIDQVMDSAMQKLGATPPEGIAREMQEPKATGNESDSRWKEQDSSKQEENLASKVV